MTASGDSLSATCAVYGEGMFDCCWDEDRDWRDRRAVERVRCRLEDVSVIAARSFDQMDALRRTNGFRKDPTFEVS